TVEKPFPLGLITGVLGGRCARGGPRRDEIGLGLPICWRNCAYPNAAVNPRTVSTNTPRNPLVKQETNLNMGTFLGKKPLDFSLTLTHHRGRIAKHGTIGTPGPTTPAPVSLYLSIVEPDRP